MEKSIVDQNDETVWYENDRLIQQYLNHSKKAKTKKEDGSVSIPPRLKIIDKSKR